MHLEVNPSLQIEENDKLDRLNDKSDFIIRYFVSLIIDSYYISVTLGSAIFRQEDEFMQYERVHFPQFSVTSYQGPHLIKLFWHSVTLLQNFIPKNDDKIGHVTILLLSGWLKVLE